MAFGSWQISLAEHSRSSFALVVLFICVQVRFFLLLPVTPMRAVSGRSRPRRVGFPTGTRRCRSSEEAHSLLGRRACAYRERRTLLQKLWLSFETHFGALSFVNPNTCHLICNNFNLNFIFGIVCLFVCVCAFSLRQESSDMILGDKPLISEVVLSHLAPLQCQMIRRHDATLLTECSVAGDKTRRAHTVEDIICYS
jgi:hypothetical protein